MHMTWRYASKQDASSLENLDIKCFDLCWDREIWKAAVENGVARIGRCEYRDVAFWFGVRVPAMSEDDRASFDLRKVGVLPAYREEGISRSAIRDLKEVVNASDTPMNITAKVCESLLYPPWPESFIGGWLQKMGFVPGEPLLTEVDHSLYGVDFHHAFGFELPRLPPLSFTSMV